MDNTEGLIAELKREGEATRRILERVPPDQLSWKPHEKSLSLGMLALHIAGLPGGLAEFLNETMREVPVIPFPEAASLSEILSSFDTYITIAENRLREWGEAGLLETWKLTREGITIMELPRVEVARTLMFNHWYHHRGQLTVYLRMLEVPLPVIYGPTADEN